MERLRRADEVEAGRLKSREMDIGYSGEKEAVFAGVLYSVEHDELVHRYTAVYQVTTNSETFLRF